jgi:hypothetical protein
VKRALTEQEAHAVERDILNFLDEQHLDEQDFVVATDMSVLGHLVECGSDATWREARAL